MYVDSNIFLLAATDKGKRGDGCRDLIILIDDGELKMSTSCIVVGEVLWVLSRKVGRDGALRIVKAMLSLPIKWVRYDHDIAIRSVEIFERTRLEPRDAVHLATMRDVGISTIVTEDADFDRISGIERIDAGECLSRFGR